jgi:hypothetical protein
VHRLAACALFLAFAAQLCYGAWTDGLTNDEVIYIAAGHRHLAARDYRWNPTHPPLAKLLHGLPLLALELREPGPHTPGGELGQAFAFVHQDGRTASILRAARLPAIFVSLVLALLTWSWARAALGASPALVALALVVFHPSLLAHGHLATTDVPAAAAMLAAAFAFWRWWQRPRTLGAGLVALAVGLGVATRLTTALFLPVFALLLAAHAWRREQDASVRGPSVRAALVLVAVLATCVPLVIWTAYGARYEPWPGATVLGPTLPRLGLPGRLVAAAAGAHLLPEAFLEAVRYQLEHNADGHPAYLLGDHGRTGWWSYPFVAFAVKNTLVFIAASVCALVYWLRLRPARRSPVALWALAVLLTFVAAAATRIQIGERYLLPAYPLLALLAAGATVPWLGTPWGRRVVPLLLVAHALPVLATAPRGYLSFFNVLAGGSRGGHRVLLDSNLDWGQDLPRLAAWMRREGVRDVQLAYHGADDPARFGIVHEDLPGLPLHAPRPAARPFTGVVVVSPNLLFGLVPRFAETYAHLRARPPDGRAGVYFVFRNQPSRNWPGDRPPG